MAIKGRLRSVAAGAAAMAAYVILGCPPASAQGTGSKDSTALTVSLEAPETRRSQAVVSATGTVVAREEVAVSAEVGGVRILEVLADEGDEVAEGEVLARLDASDLRVEARRQAAAVAEAEATLAAAVSSRDRARKLLDGRSVSVEAFEERQTAVGTAEARLEQARAAAEALELSLGRAEVRSPVAGYVSSRTAVAGSLQQQGGTMFTVVAGSLVELRAEVPQQALPAISEGDAARVSTPGGGTVEGSVRLVSRRVDETSRLGTVLVSVPAGSGLLPGMFAGAEIVTGESEALSVPERAVIWREGKSAVYLVVDGRAELRPVEIGQRGEGRVAVLSGLKAGESVVSLGAGFLNPGDRVSVSGTEDRP